MCQGKLINKYFTLHNLFGSKASPIKIQNFACILSSKIENSLNCLVDSCDNACLFKLIKKYAIFLLINICALIRI